MTTSQEKKVPCTACNLEYIFVLCLYFVLKMIITDDKQKEQIKLNTAIGYNYKYWKSNYRAFFDRFDR